ncbi:cytochrome c biogenesis protein CcsA [Deltaproteobacteria bacterium TL4]
MITTLGLWLSILFYLISWGSGLSLASHPSDWRLKVYIQSCRIGCLIHSITLIYSLYYLGHWPQTFISDLLSFVAWLSIIVLILFRTQIENIINSAVVPVFAVVLMIISSGISAGSVPALIFFEQASWLRQALLVTHIVTLIAGHILFALACGSSILFLYQEHQIKTKLVRVLVNRFPSLGTLNQISYRATLWGFMFLTMGLSLGILMRDNLQGFATIGIRRGISLLVWLTYAMFLIEHQIQGYQGKRIAFWPIIGFFIVMMGVGVEIYHLNLAVR